MSDLGDRLRQIRKALPQKSTQGDFAQSIGMTRSAYSQYELGNAAPPPATMKLICMTYGVNPQWLETGEGEPYLVEPTDMLRQSVASIMQGESDFAVSVITSLAAMPSEWWDAWEKELYRIRDSIEK